MRQSQHGVAWIGILTVMVACFATPARAQSGSMAGAEALLAEGNRLFDKKDYPAALVKFQQAHQLHQDPSILVNLGLTLEKLDRLPEAAARFERFLGWADPRIHARLVKGIRPKLEGLRKKLGRVTVQCAVTGAVVSVDGKPLGTTPLKHSLYLMPGSHEIAVSAAGHQPFKETLQARAGALHNVAAVLEPASPEKRSPEEPALDKKLFPASAPASTTKDKGTPIYKKWWFWTAVGVAVVGGSVAIIVPNALRDTKVPGGPTIDSKKFTLGASF